MDIQTLTSFLMWCTIINGSLFFVSVTFTTLAPDLVYRLQSGLYPLPRETYNIVMYSFIGLFKIIFLVFNVVPFLALLILG